MAEFRLFQSIANLVDIKNQMTSIRQENPVLGIKTFLLKVFKLFKEGRDMNDTSRSDEIDRARVHEAFATLAEFGN